mgnify:CR=1 FL=1
MPEMNESELYIHESFEILKKYFLEQKLELREHHRFSKKSQNLGISVHQIHDFGLDPVTA